MSFWEVILKLFNGNETARAMRYSSFLIIAVIVAGYYKVIPTDTVTTVITATTGYIFGKARAETHIVQPKIDRRKDGDTHSD